MSAYSDLVIADGAFGYYRLGDASGTTAVDAGTNGNGTYVGSPTLAVAGGLVGDADTAVTFASASSQRVDVPYTSAHQSGDCTYECWMKTTTVVTATGFLGEGNTTGGALQGFLGMSATAGKPRFILRNSATTAFTIDATATYNDGAWHHVVGTELGTAMTLYVDGVSVGTATFSGSKPTLDKSVIAARYANSATASAYFDGTLDECAIYKLALTAAQVANHYNYGKGFVIPASNRFVRQAVQRASVI